VIDGTTAARQTLTSSATSAVAGTYFLLDQLPAGGRSIVARYAGSGQNPAAESGRLVHQRLLATTTTVDLGASNISGAQLPLAIRVTPDATTGSGQVVTGSVRVRVDGVAVATTNLANGIANVTVPAGAAGAHDLVVEYLGASPFGPSQSAVAAYTVGPSVIGVTVPLIAISNAGLNVLTTSAPVTVRGLAAPAVLSVSGGEVAIGCGESYTRTPSVIVEGQTLCVRVVAAGAPGVSQSASINIAGVTSTFTVTTGQDARVSYQDIWWTPGENGHGTAIIQHGPRLFAACYHYDAGGQPRWVVLPGGTWNAGQTEFTGSLFQPTGSLFSRYDESRYAITGPAGSATLRFTASDAASISYTVGSSTGTKPLTRFSFGTTGTSPMAVGDLWWGGTGNNGWGISISQQAGALFLAWYTYDAAGQTQWFVAPAGRWLGEREWMADVFRATGAPVLGVNYDPARASASKVGTLTLTFDDQNRASMDFDVAGERGKFRMTRLAF
jgi:hypothetical protein